MITVVGMDGSPLSPQAQAALAAATLVVGARRHLAAVSAIVPAASVPAGGAAEGGGPAEGRLGEARTIVLGELAPALDALAGHHGDAVVLASGDPGFFGIVRALRERGLKFTVQPAVSSVALAFARAGLPWDDAMVVSAHGRDPRPAVNVCRAHPKVAVLTGPGCGPAEIGTALDRWQRRLVVAEHLGTGAERLTECTPAEAAGRTWEDPNVVLVLAASESVIMAMWPSEEPYRHDHLGRTGLGGPAAGTGEVDGASEISVPGWLWPRRVSLDQGLPGRAMPGGWALAEEEFDSRDAVLTKAEVRALALGRLGPGPGMLVWDVGAGIGSVAVECARFGAAVIALERDPLRCDRIAANARRHGVDVRVALGEAPEALQELPDPDAVFVGGGGAAVIEAVAARRPARIVVALAAVERAGLALAALTEAGYATGGALLQAARFAPLPGDVHRLAATNPVFLVWATTLPGTTNPGGSADPGNAGPNTTGPTGSSGPASAGPGTAESASPAGPTASGATGPVSASEPHGPGTWQAGSGAPP